VPHDYLCKVLQSLGRSGIVQAHRGKHGGFRLATPADRLTILEVVNAVDPIRRIRQCPLGLKSHGRRLCPLHRRLDDAMLLIEDGFRETTIADLLADTSSVRPLCEIAEVTHV
jgi:Rrf2 family protein